GGPAPPDRPGARAPCGRALGAAAGLGVGLRRPRRRREGGIPARRRRGGLARRAGHARPVPPRRWVRARERLLAGEPPAGDGLHLTTSPVDWYAARAAGAAAYVLLTAVFCLGMTVAGQKHIKYLP